MSLYNAYRPQAFEEIIGNDTTVKSLQRLLARPRKEVPHAFLFSGPSGCGKTTLARLVAKSLGCTGMNLQELDTAHFRGIDTVREVRNAMNLCPTGGGTCRVWIFDEVHQTTKDAQSALLKALEDAPAHAYFLLATTEPEKLLPTLVNRCSRFEVAALTDREMGRLLAEIIAAESKPVPDEVVQTLVDNSLGSPRAALVALDALIDLDPEEMKAQALQVLESQNKAIELFRALLSGKPSWKAIAGILSGLSDDPESVRRAGLGYAMGAILRGDCPRAYLILDAFRETFFYTGKPGLVRACYEIVFGGGK